MAAFLPGFLATLFLVICILLIIVVLLQKGRGGGLSAAFGGAGSSAFGTRTGDVFTWVTIVLTALFLLLAIVTTIAHRMPSGTVAPPQFSPLAGPIQGPTPVRITCRTGGASIHYTLDGSDPTPEAKAYESPLTIQPGQTIRARAYRPGWDKSAIAEAHYPQFDASTEQLQDMLGELPTAAPNDEPVTAPTQTDSDE